MDISDLVFLECRIGFIGGAVGSIALWHEKFRVKQFLNTSYVKSTLNREFAALSYSQVAKISAIFGASIFALAFMGSMLANHAQWTEDAQENTANTVFWLSAIAGGAYLYTRRINILKIGVSVAGTVCMGVGLITSFAIKYFTQKKLFG